MDMKVEHAYRKSIETVVHWIQTKLNSSKTQVFFRTYSPVHFRFASFLKANVVSSIQSVFCVLFGEVNCYIIYYAEEGIGGLGETVTWRHFQSWDPHWCLLIPGPNSR